MFDIIKNFNNDYKKINTFKKIHNGKKVFIFTVNYDWLKFCVSCASILSLRGCKVTVTFNKRWDFNNVNQRIVKKIYNDFIKNLSSLKISDDINIIEFNTEDKDYKISDQLKIKIKKQVKIDMCHNYHVVDFKNIDQSKKIFDDMENYYINLAISLIQFLKNNKFDKYILPVATNYGWAICRLVFEHLNLKYTSMEGSISFQDHKIVLCRNYPVVNFDDVSVKNEWSKYKNKKNIQNLKESNIKQLNKIYNPKVKSSLQSSKKNNLKKDCALRILILPSFVHEMHYRLKHFCFKDQNDWFFSTLNYLYNNKKKYQNIQIVIRFHPLPVYASGKNIDLENFSSSEEYTYNIFKKKNKEFKNFFKYIPPDKLANSNTLDLIKSSDLILTYQSACGLEAALLNKTVVNLTNCVWSGNGFSYEPKTQNDYFEILDKFSKNKLEKLNHIKAHYFFDFFHNHYHVDFIWNMQWGGEFDKKYDVYYVVSLVSALNSHFKNFDYLINENTSSLDEFKLILAEIDNAIRCKKFKIAIKMIGLRGIFLLNKKNYVMNKFRIILIFYYFLKVIFYKFLYIFLNR